MYVYKHCCNTISTQSLDNTHIHHAVIYFTCICQLCRMPAHPCIHPCGAWLHQWGQVPLYIHGHTGIHWLHWILLTLVNQPLHACMHTLLYRCIARYIVVILWQQPQWCSVNITLCCRSTLTIAGSGLINQTAFLGVALIESISVNPREAVWFTRLHRFYSVSLATAYVASYMIS